jgi:hypothetical protein
MDGTGDKEDFGGGLIFDPSFQPKPGHQARLQLLEGN